jgi:hypothetical protein
MLYNREMDPETKILKFPANGTASPSPASQAEKSLPAQIETPEQDVASKPPPETPPPVWMQRLFLITTVIICLWLGLVLAVLPWTAVWTDNSLVLGSPRLRQVLSTGFIRGLVTGLGLVDLWIGISEAVHYRDRR